jgi:hypothetical protein
MNGTIFFRKAANIIARNQSPISISTKLFKFVKQNSYLKNCTMHHPFQVIAAIALDTPYLIASSGSSLLCASLENGTITTKWQTRTVTQQDEPLSNVRNAQK